MISDPDVICPHCKKTIGTQKMFMFMYIAPPGYVCKHCGKIAIPFSGPVY